VVLFEIDFLYLRRYIPTSDKGLMPKNKRLHFKDLNALRGMAFFPVFLFCTLHYLSYGQDGMLKEMNFFIQKIAQNSLDFFFLLSSFLLTSHALREYKYTETFSLKKYFVRRIFRIAPVLIISLLFTFVFHPWMNDKLDLHEMVLPDFEPYLYLMPNYFSNPGAYDFIYIVVIASIYLFIQFYIVWGFILKYLIRFISSICIGMVIVGLIARAIHFQLNTDYFLDTLSYGIPIGIGGFLASALRKDAQWVTYLKELSKNVNGFIYIAGGILVFGGYILFNHQIASIMVPVLTSAFYGYIIIEQTFGKNSFIQLKNQKILTYFGRMSYGLIVYQSLIGFLVLIAFESLEGNLSSNYTILLVILSTFVGSSIAANISYKIFEKPMLRLRREFKKV
jgi:peptidoglycan/LPS O-acetylase OafA/YrhL